MTSGLAGATGIFGGTFNPVHWGHLRVAEEVREALALGRLVFVPNADPPLKRDGPEPLAPPETRLRWVERATADNPAFEVDACELDREGASYSVDTLRMFQDRLGEPPVFLLGGDAFRELPLWWKPRELLSLTHVAVMTRPPHLPGGLGDWLAPELAEDFDWDPGGESGRHRSAGTRVVRVAVSALDVSATDVRRRLREGRSVRYLLPPAVHDEVVASGIYGGPS